MTDSLLIHITSFVPAVKSWYLNHECAIVAALTTLLVIGVALIVALVGYISKRLK